MTHFSRRDIFWAWLSATLLSGVPSTLYALVTGGDVLEATRAAGAMALPADTALPQLLIAAGCVHAVVSLFWAVVLAFILPYRAVMAWAIVASGLIAIVDLRMIAPQFFPEVAKLAFWPQFADHLAWGASFGIALQLRQKRTQAIGRKA